MTYLSRAGYQPVSASNAPFLAHLLYTMASLFKPSLKTFLQVVQIFRFQLAPKSAWWAAHSFRVLSHSTKLPACIVQSH